MDYHWLHKSEKTGSIPVPAPNTRKVKKMRVKEGIISLLKESPNLTAADIVERTQFSNESVKVTLCKLMNAKRIERFKGIKRTFHTVGPNNVFYYHLPKDPEA